MQDVLLIAPNRWLQALDEFAKIDKSVKFVRRPMTSVIDGVAYIDVQGTLVKSAAEINSDRFTGYAEIAQAIRRIDTNTPIVLRVNSGGGTLDGIDLALNAIKGRTNITTQVDGLCCSAAYWLASQTKRISATRLSEVGGLGVYSVIYDTSRMLNDAGIEVKMAKTGALKGAGYPGTPVTDEIMDDLQSTVENVGKMFFDDVKSAREKVELAKVTSGKSWLAAEAKELNLIDVIEGGQRMDDEKVEVAEEETVESTDDEKTEQDSVAQERERVMELLSLFADRDYAQEAVKNGWSVFEAKAHYFDRQKPVAHSAVSPVATAPAAEPEASQNFIAMARRLAEEKGISLSEAAAQIAKQYPDAYQEYARG